MNSDADGANFWVDRGSFGKEEHPVNTFGAMFNMQFRRLCARNEAKYAVTIMLIMITAAFIESCLRFQGEDAGAVPCAAYGWVGNMDNMQIQSMHTLYLFLLFLIAALVFADSFFVDVKSRIANLIAMRSSLPVYLASTGLLAFLGGFLIVCVPFLLSQAFALVVFPAVGAANSFTTMINTNASDSGWTMVFAQNALFPPLFFNHPYLNNLVFIFYASFWAGIMSLMSFVISLFTRKSRLVVLGVPTLVFLLTFFLLPQSMAPANYLYPSTLIKGLSPVWFFVEPVVLLILLVAAAVVVVRRNKDLLL